MDKILIDVTVSVKRKILIFSLSNTWPFKYSNIVSVISMHLGTYPTSIAALMARCSWFIKSVVYGIWKDKLLMNLNMSPIIVSHIPPTE